MASSSLCFWFSVPLPVPSILHMQIPNLPGYECAHRPLPSAPIPCLVTQALQIRSPHPLSSLPCSPHSPRAQSPGSPDPTTTDHSLHEASTHSTPTPGPSSGLSAGVGCLSSGNPSLLGFLPLCCVSLGIATLASLAAVTKPLTPCPTARVAP